MENKASKFSLQKQQTRNPITDSIDPEATTKSKIIVKSHPSDEADGTSLKDEDLDDMVNSSCDDEGDDVDDDVDQNK